MDELNNGSNTEQWQTNSVGPETNGSDGFGQPQIGPYAALAGKTREVLSSNLVLAMIISLAVSILCSISAAIIGSKTALFQVVDYFEPSSAPRLLSLQPSDILSSGFRQRTARATA